MPVETRTVQPVAPYEPGAAGRLARARRKAWESVATIAANHGDRAADVIRNMAADDWRTHARGRFNMTAARQAGQWQNPADARRPSERAYYADSFASLGWRDLGTAEEVSRREGSRAVEHSGWYCDAFASETVGGRVLQLPARGGVPRYVAGIEWSAADGVTVYPLQTYAEPLEAARAADAIAKREAESEREYSTTWQAGARFADLGAEVADLRRKALAILAERRAVRGVNAPNLCAAIRERLESILSDIARKRQERDTLASGDAEPLYFWSGEDRLREAFNEGAGATILA